MKIRVLAACLCLCASSALSAQTKTLHVTAVRLWQPTDAPRVTRSFETFVVLGTVGQEHYQLQQLKVWGTHLLQVGHDYPILKLKPRSLVVSVPGKKKDTERLDVTGVSE
jgi:hypothetical protein